MVETYGREPSPIPDTGHWQKLQTWVRNLWVPSTESARGTHQLEPTSEAARKTETAPPPETIRIPKVYFHTFERANFRPELGVMSQGRHDNVTDFPSWSLFFPYEKIGNYWGATPRRAVTMVDAQGQPNFSVMIMDDASPVTKVTDRYKRAYVAKEPQPLDEQTQQDLAEKGIWTGAAQQTIDQSHFIAELPISRELQQRFTQLKVEVATFQTTQPQLENKLKEFLATLSPDKQPIFKQEGSDLDSVCRLLANAMMRDFAQRFIPALARLSRHSTHFTPDQKGRLWAATRQLFSSEALVRYLTQTQHQLEEEGVIAHVEEAPRLTPLQARVLMLTLNHDASTGQRYLPSPGDTDFHGYYFSSGELTFWAKRTGRDDLLEGRDQGAFNSTKIANYPDLQSLVMLSDAYELRDGQPKSRFLVGIDAGGWSIAQMLDQPPTDTTSFEQRSEDKREQTKKYFLGFWTRPAAEEMETYRNRRLSIAAEFAQRRSRETLPPIPEDSISMSKKVFQILTGTEPSQNLATNLTQLRELGIAVTPGSYGEHLALDSSDLTQETTALTFSDHQLAIAELDQPNSAYRTTNLWQPLTEREEAS